MRKNIKNQKGFTLIELLVVVVIIGILSSLLMVNFVGIRQRARDAQRKSDLEQIRSALEMYRADKGSYPAGDTESDRSCWINNEGNSTCPPLGALKDGGYMAKVPIDPLNQGREFYEQCGKRQYYSYSSNGLTYRLSAVEEIKGEGGCELKCRSMWSLFQYCVFNP